MHDLQEQVEEIVRSAIKLFVVAEGDIPAPIQDVREVVVDIMIRRDNLELVRMGIITQEEAALLLCEHLDSRVPMMHRAVWLPDAVESIRCAIATALQRPHGPNNRSMS